MVVQSARPLRIGLVAGEASSDQLGARLIASIQKVYPRAVFVGVGGPSMRKAGMDTWHDSEEISVAGIAELLKHVPRLWKLRKSVARRLLDWKPDVFVGLDSEDFNLGVEHKLRKAALCTVHYSSLPIWAWRESRIKRLRDSAQRVLCMFPTEPALYRRYGIDARFVGHPLAREFAITPDQASARTELKLESTGTVIAIICGGDLREISRSGATFVAAAIHLRRHIADLRFVAPMADAFYRAEFERMLRRPPHAKVDPSSNPPSAKEWTGFRQILTLTDGQAHQAMIASDVIMLASGNEALEGMLAKRPIVIAHRAPGLIHAVVQRLGLLKTSRSSVANILSGEQLVPELMHAECTPDHIAEAVEDWLKNPSRAAKVTARFKTIHASLLGSQDAAARSVLELASALEAAGRPRALTTDLS